MFLVGRDMQQEQLQAQEQDADLLLLSQEAAQYGDLLIGDFLDTFRNLAQKVNGLDKRVVIPYFYNQKNGQLIKRIV